MGLKPESDSSDKHKFDSNIGEHTYTYQKCYEKNGWMIVNQMAIQGQTVNLAKMINVNYTNCTARLNFVNSRQFLGITLPETT